MKRTLLVVLLVLLALAIVVNYTDLLSPDIFKGHDGPPLPPGALIVEPPEPVDPVEPIGPADAPVKLEVFYEQGDPCNGQVEGEALEFAERYAPNMRLELLPWYAEGTEERAEELAVDCRVHLEISGTANGAKPAVFIGPTDVGDWTWDQIADEVDARLAEAGVEAPPREETEETVDEEPEANDGLSPSAP